MNNPSPPPAPDPKATSAAATNSNVNTAIATGQLDNTNQVTPQGTLTYTKTDNVTKIPDGNGGFIDVPQWTATTALSPEQQNLYNLGVKTQTNIGQIGVDQSKKIGDLLGTPVDLSPNAVSGYLTDLGNKRLAPELDRQWAAREADLFNRGILPGSEQYKNEQDAFNRQRNDAYDQLLLQGNQQAVSQILAQRNQPINETTALLSGSQVSQPNFVNTPSPTVAPVDVGGITNNAYSNDLQSYGIQQSANNAFMGGIAGLGGAALGGWAYGGFKQPKFA